MAGNELVREKVRGYLSGLSSSARQMLLRQLETSAQGSALDDVRTILEAAREIEEESRRPPAPKTAPKSAPEAPKPDLKTLFFQPFKPHVIEEVLPRHQAGWISKPSLDGIWTYLAREVLPETLAPFVDPEHGFHVSTDEERAALVRDLRVEAFAKLDRIVAAAKDDDLAHQRVQSRVGGPQVYEDLVELLTLRDRIVGLERLYAKLPVSVVMGEGSESILRDVVTPQVLASPSDAALIAAGVSGRLSSPAILVRLATVAAQSDDPKDVRRAPLGPFVDVAISCLERKAMRCEAAIRSPGMVIVAMEQVKKFHDGVRAISSALQIENDAAWRQRMSQIRREMSDVVGREIDQLIPIVRRAFHLGPSAKPSVEDATDAEKAVAVYAMARRCRDSLALNETINRIGQTAEQAIDLYGRELFDKIRKSSGRQKDDLVAISENLLRMAEHLQGDEYAQFLRRSRDKAAKDAG